MVRDSTYPYTYTMTDVAPGSYSLVAKATDNKGLTGLSASIAVQVAGTVNKAPTVSIVSPANNAAYTAPANVTINALANDPDGTISNVKFYNGPTYLRMVTTSPYTYTLSNLPAGTYTLTAKATDNSGAQTISAPVTVTVKAPNKAPVVSVTSPVNNAAYTAPASITIKATASDADGTISNVKFYNGTTYLRMVTTSPYTYTLSNLAAGTYTFTAKATDNNGAQTISASVTVKVSNASIVSRPLPVSSEPGVSEDVSVKLAPNPATNVLNVYTKGFKEDKPLTISVISTDGVIRKTLQVNGSTKQVQLNVAGFLSGVYTIKLTSGDKVLYKQFVKL